MAGITMNVGPSAISAAGSSGGGSGQTLGNAQGSITINVHNVTQANNLLQNSAKKMQQAFNNVASAATSSSRAQIAAAKAAAAQANLMATQAGAASKITISNLNAQTAQTTATHKQSMQTAQQVAQAARTTSAQQSQAYQATSQAAKLAAQAQTTAWTQANRAAQQGATTYRNAINSQILANRLFVSNLNATAAAARAAQRAQNQAAQGSQGGWSATAKTLKEIQTQLLVIGAGAGLIARSGVMYAATMQEAKIQLTGIVGNAETATELIAELQTKGRNAGIPFQQMLTFATQLLPVLERDTEQLEKWFDITRRTAVLNRGPTGGLQGAAFSLREAFLSVQQGGRDFVSLADRFNISKKALQDALRVSGGDFVAAIDAVLTKMGITTDLADDMADSFNASFAVAKDAALQALGAGFTPLLDALGAGLRVLADWLVELQKTSPELLGMATGVLTIVAAGAPLLLLLSNLTTAWATLGVTAQASITKMLGIAGVTIAALAVGKQVGTWIGNSIIKSQGQEARTPEQVNQNINELFFNITKGLQEVSISYERSLYELVAATMDVASAFRTIEAEIYRRISMAVPAQFQGFFQDLATAAQGKAGEATASGDAVRQKAAENEAMQRRRLLEYGQEMGVYPQLSKVGGSNEFEETSKYSDKQVDRMVKYSEDLTNLFQDTFRRLEDETESYNDQRSKLQASYQKSSRREEEDFYRQRAKAEKDYYRSVRDLIDDSARQRARWERDLGRSIAEAQADSADRVAQMTEDYAEAVAKSKEDSEKKIADLIEDNDEKIEKKREDTLKKIADMEEEYNKERLQAQKDHAESLRRAAGQFDAYAIAREERAFRKSQEEAAEAQKERQLTEREGFQEFITEQRESLKKAIEQEKENLAERLDEQEKAYKKRLENEAESLQKSIDQQKLAFQRRVEDQAEDDALRLKEMEDSFREQRRLEDDERRLKLERQAEDYREQLSQLDTEHDKRIAQIVEQSADQRGKLDEEFAKDLVALDVRLDAFEAKMQNYEDIAVATFDNVWTHMIEKMGAGYGTQAPPDVNPFINPGSFPSLSPSSNSSTTNVGGDTVTINIYATANQSAKDVGEAAITAYMQRAGSDYKH